MPIKHTPYGAQWQCDKKVSRQRGGKVVSETCNANGIAADRTKAQQALDTHVKREHR